MTEMVFHTVKYDISIWEKRIGWKKELLWRHEWRHQSWFLHCKTMKIKKAIVKETKTGFLQKLQILCCSIFGYCRKDGHFSESICRIRRWLVRCRRESWMVATTRNCCIPTTTRRWSTTSNHATCLLKLKWIIFRLSQKLRNWESFWNMKKRKHESIRQHHYHYHKR